MAKNILTLRGFKMNQALAVLAVFTLIALLLMVEKVAQVVTEAGNNMGINMPAVPILRNTAANLVLIGVGALLILFAGLVLIPVVKFSILIVGIGLAGYGIYQVYKMVKGEPMKDILPK
jgi:hypothetical protein